ncbi:hypothetical protein QZH41_014657 [Actinostola sp. cb2023]|nr:hypothetical protein QZH41_014657 [Actinostola sp. cb2023]
MQSTQMDTEWTEYQCKSGQTLFIYNKVTGEHKWTTQYNNNSYWREAIHMSLILVTRHFGTKYPLQGIYKVILERRHSNVLNVIKSLDTKAISEDIADGSFDDSRYFSKIFAREGIPRGMIAWPRPRGMIAWPQPRGMNAWPRPRGMIVWR